MHKYLIMFERKSDDEALPNPANASERFQQLDREMEGLLPLRFISLTRTAYPQDMILCEVQSKLGVIELANWMQEKLYDDQGVDGYFNIIAEIEGDVMMPITVDELNAAPCFQIMREDYPNEPDDGHEHEFEDADGVDTKTDADPIICVKCGMLSVRESEEDDQDYDNDGNLRAGCGHNE